MMIKRRRRFKQTVALSDRLRRFADEANEKMRALPYGDHRDELVQKVQMVERALELEGYLSSRELRPHHRGPSYVRRDISFGCRRS
jgi:hypothetical protein